MSHEVEAAATPPPSQQQPFKRSSRVGGGVDLQLRKTRRQDVLDCNLHRVMLSQVIVSSILAKYDLETHHQETVFNELAFLASVVLEQRDALQYDLAAAAAKTATTKVVNEKVSQPPAPEVILPSSSSSAEVVIPPPPPPPPPKETFADAETDDVVLLVYPSSPSGENSATTLSDVKGHVDLKKLAIRVAHTRPIRNGGIAIRFQSLKDLEKFEVEFRTNLLSTRYNIRRPVKLDPRVIVFEVDPECGGEETVLQAIADQVRRDQDDHHPPPRIQLRKKTQTQHSNHNYVVSVDGDSFRRLVGHDGKGKLHVDWKAYAVREYDTVKQCYRCGRFGHFNKYCQTEQASCTWCADVRHDYEGRRCDRRAHCVNCAERNERESSADGRQQRGTRRPPLPTNHSAHDRVCPIRQFQVALYRKRIDYGTGTRERTPLH